MKIFWIFFKLCFITKRSLFFLLLIKGMSDQNPLRIKQIFSSSAENRAVKPSLPAFCLPPSDCLATSAMAPIPRPTASPAAETEIGELLFRDISNMQDENI